MHTDLLDIFVKRIRTRVSQGDCPTEPVLSTENLEDAVLALADDVERLTRGRDEAYGYASRFLTSFVAQHCNPVPGWAPLHDLIGVLTQIDNASTVAREYRSELTTLTARTREVLAPFVGPFVRRRDAYARRYSDTVLGYANFDKMPDRWPMEKIEFLMGEFRAANTLFNELKEKDNG